MASEVELAWAAGFIDGEGYFGAIKGNGLSKRSYRLIVRASQAGRREPCDRLQEMLGGTVYKLSLKNSGRGAKAPLWRWSVDGAPAIRRVVPLLLPHLVVKRREAELLLALSTLIKPRGMPGPKGYTNEQIAEMDTIAAAIKEERILS